MLGAGIYPITLAEMASYSRDADELFNSEDHENLKLFIAFHPEYGDIIPATGGVRILRWPIKNTGNMPPLRIIYFFRDLNMPVFLLAIYKKGERIPLNAEWRQTIGGLVGELVEQYSNRWALVIARQENSA